MNYFFLKKKETFFKLLINWLYLNDNGEAWGNAVAWDKIHFLQQIRIFFSNYFFMKHQNGCIEISNFVEIKVVEVLLGIGLSTVNSPL